MLFRSIIAYADLSGVSLTPNLVDVALADLLPENPNIPPEDILEVVASHSEIKIDDLVGQNRSAKIAAPRQIAMYILSQYVKVSSPQIGELLGGRDHSTVLHGINKVVNDEKLKKRADTIWNSLRSQRATA